MNLCCMDNTQQKVMCKFFSVFPYVCFSYTKYKDEVGNGENVVDIALSF